MRQGLAPGETAKLGKADSTFGCCVLPSPRGALAHASRSSVHSQAPAPRPKLHFLLALDCKTQLAAHADGTRPSRFLPALHSRGVSEAAAGCGSSGLADG